jgi:hypothetical protein
VEAIRPIETINNDEYMKALASWSRFSEKILPRESGTPRCTPTDAMVAKMVAREIGVDDVPII